MSKIINTHDKFWTKIKITNFCWEWTGGKRKGYGLFGLDGKSKSAHRYSYELFKGDIEKGMTIDHLCRNRACVNPNHLESVTNKENVLRGFGLTAINARKTHCLRGHILSGENLYVHKNNYRACKQCMKNRNKILFN